MAASELLFPARVPANGRYPEDAPANNYGDAPFTTPGGFSTPNEAYFAHAGAIHKATQEKLSTEQRKEIKQ